MSGQYHTIIDNSTVIATNIFFLIKYENKGVVLSDKYVTKSLDFDDLRSLECEVCVCVGGGGYMVCDEYFNVG